MAGATPGQENSAIVVLTPATLTESDRSCGHGCTAVYWTMDDVKEVAMNMFKAFPKQVHDLLATGPFKGNILKIGADDVG